MEPPPGVENHSQFQEALKRDPPGSLEALVGRQGDAGPARQLFLCPFSIQPQRLHPLGEFQGDFLGGSGA